MGDFNARHRLWNNHINYARGKRLVRSIEQNNVNIESPDESTRIATTPNHTDGTLDIALVKNTVINMETIINELTLDHLPVKIEIFA